MTDPRNGSRDEGIVLSLGRMRAVPGAVATSFRQDKTLASCFRTFRSIVPKVPGLCFGIRIRLCGWTLAIPTGTGATSPGQAWPTMPATRFAICSISAWAAPARSEMVIPLGLGYYYSGTSDEVGPILQTVFGPIGDCQGVEAFYRTQLTRSISITPDFQWLSQARQQLDDSYLVGARMNIAF